jgi:hypothetical protein
MKKTIMILLLFTIIILLASQLAFAQEDTEKQGLRVNLLNPSVTYRNRTVGDVIEGSVRVSNNNNFDISVEAVLQQEAEEIVFGENPIFLKPGEEGMIKYNLTVIDSASKSYLIGVKFSTEHPDVGIKQFSLAHAVNLAQTNEKEENYVWTIIIIIAVIILVIVGFMLVRQNR